MKELKIKMDLKWDKIGSFTRADPYSINFCYPIEGTPFIIKGGSQQTLKILKNIDLPCFANITIWQHGQSYSNWRFYGVSPFRIYVERTYLKARSYRHPTGFKIVVYDPDIKCVDLEKYRKLPQAFPKAVKEYLKQKGY